MTIHTDPPPPTECGSLLPPLPHFRAEQYPSCHSGESRNLRMHRRPCPVRWGFRWPGAAGSSPILEIPASAGMTVGASRPRHPARGYARPPLAFLASWRFYNQLVPTVQVGNTQFRSIRRQKNPLCPLWQKNHVNPATPVKQGHENFHQTATMSTKSPLFRVRIQVPSATRRVYL